MWLYTLLRQKNPNTVPAKTKEERSVKNSSLVYGWQTRDTVAQSTCCTWAPITSTLCSCFYRQPKLILKLACAQSLATLWQTNIGVILGTLCLWQTSIRGQHYKDWWDRWSFRNRSWAPGLCPSQESVLLWIVWGGYTYILSSRNARWSPRSMCKVWTDRKSRFGLPLQRSTGKAGEVEWPAQAPALTHFHMLFKASSWFSLQSVVHLGFEMLVLGGDLHHRHEQVHSLSCSSSTLLLPGAEGDVWNWWWTSHLSVMRREAALWDLGLAERNRKDIRKAEESTLGRAQKERDSRGRKSSC